MRFSGLVGVLVGAWLGTGAWAQPGGGAAHGPQRGATQAGHAVEREPHPQRDELRALIRQQRSSVREEEDPGAQRHPRQLSPEERQNLRNQLRQQRAEDWRSPP